MSTYFADKTRSLRPGPVLWLGLLLLTLLISACGLDVSPGMALTPPAGYALLGEADLSARAYDAVALGQLEIREPALVGIFYALPDAETAYFDLRLDSPDGDSQLILHSEDFRTDGSGGGVWESRLEPGVYELVLNSRQGTGVLSAYWDAQ